MKVLLDTHAVLWWFIDDPKLGKAASDTIRSGANAIHVSAASAYEITFKHARGRLPGFDRLITNLPRWMEEERFTPLPVTLHHALHAGRLANPHGDPFDRILIAQAQAEGMILLSNERAFDSLGVQRIW